MAEYRAPLADLQFALNDVADLAAVSGSNGATPELVNQVLDEAGRFASEVLAPLNRSGDLAGARIENGVVRVPDGFAEAYGRFVDGGWNAVCGPTTWGGQGLPWVVSTALNEIWQSANMSLANCMMLTQGAVELLTHHGTEAQKRTYLPKLISGEWSGTMNLTEPSRRFGPRAAADPCGRGQRRLAAPRPEDLHYLRRPRHVRQHRALGAGASARRAARGAGDLAFSCFQARRP